MYTVIHSQCTTSRACSELVQNLAGSTASLACCRSIDTATHAMWPQGPHTLASSCKCSCCVVEFVG